MDRDAERDRGGEAAFSSAAATWALVDALTGERPAAGSPAGPGDAVSSLEAFEVSVGEGLAAYHPPAGPATGARDPGVRPPSGTAGLDEVLEEAARLREANRWKDGFLAAATHDLRAALAVIRGAAEALLADPEVGPEETLELGGIVLRQTTKLARLLEELLESARFTGRAGTPDRQRTDVAALVEEVVADVEWHSHPVVVEVEPVEVDVDVAQLKQVVTNLLRNAVAHTPPDTAIRVGAGVEEGRLLVVVEDDGPGVPPDIRASLFDPFVTRSAHPADEDGTGIGLSLVRLFAELHGGSARLEETPAGGARFVVDLPARRRSVDGLYSPGRSTRDM